MANRLVVAVYKRLPKGVRTWLVHRLKKTYVIGVAAIVIDDKSRILVLRHTYDTPAWRLPGGMMEAMETPEDVARREVWEEAKCHILPIAVIDGGHTSQSFDVAVLARVTSIEAFEASAEVVERAWFAQGDLSRLPSLQQAFVEKALRYLQERNA